MTEAPNMVAIPGAVGVEDSLVSETPAMSDAELSSQMSLLVQSLADALPDDTVVFARQAVERGDCSAAAHALIFAVLRFGIGMSVVEYTVLAECLDAMKEESEALPYLAVDDAVRPLMYNFVAVPPDSEQPVVELDDQMLAMVAQRPGVLGVWRSWRYPMTASEWPPPRPVYLVEASDSGTASTVAAAAYGADSQAVDARSPLIEVYLTGTQLTPLLQAMQFGAELLHADRADRGFVFADVFDGVPGPEGVPQEIERLDAEEADVILAYLSQGRLVMMAEAPADDLLDAERTGAVPLHLRTDGAWIWSDATAYYLAEHAVAPPREFRAYLAAAGAVAPPVPDARLHLVAAWLQADDGADQD